MNNKIKSEKYRKLSIAALVTGIIPYIFTPVIPFITDPASPYEVYFSNYTTLIMSFYIGIAFSLTTAAIVCGSVDLRRVKMGLNSIKGKGFDIAGIILGSIGIIYIILVIILVLVQSLQIWVKN
jgi:hypothetical protein